MTPGEALEIWVGCSGKLPIGFGFGGLKGDAPLAGDGGFGGDGSAITTTSGDPLLVAGGGGGGGGDSLGRGGTGGAGGIDPQPGQKNRGQGGCVQCQQPGDGNGLNGHEGGVFSGGGGGGGGGGWEGGGGGSGGEDDSGGGGGGGGLSFADPLATDVVFGTSQLPGDGVVVIHWDLSGPQPVPEPATALLFVIAMASLALPRLRRPRLASRAA